MVHMYSYGSLVTLKVEAATWRLLFLPEEMLTDPTSLKPELPSSFSPSLFNNSSIQIKQRPMKSSPILILQIAVIFAVFAGFALAIDHIVGGSIWTIPPCNDFYSNWSQNKSFTAGDSLVFRFEMGFYNVVQVSKREFDSCSAENPFRTFLTGPETVHLNEEGVLYFICSFGNYCLLGQKLSVSVQRRPPPPPAGVNSSSPASP